MAGCMYSQDGSSNGSRGDSRGEGRNDGRNDGRTDSRGPREESHANRSPRTGRNDYGRSAPAPRDPFFDKPYESPVAADAAALAWGGHRAPSGTQHLVKHKVKVPLLFKASNPRRLVDSWSLRCSTLDLYQLKGLVRQRR